MLSVHKYLRMLKRNSVLLVCFSSDRNLRVQNVSSNVQKQVCISYKLAVAILNALLMYLLS